MKNEVSFPRIPFQIRQLLEHLNFEQNTDDCLIDDRHSIESQKRSFRTFVFQSTRYLTSSTGRSNEGFLFDNDDAEPKKPASSSSKQLVLIEVS